MKSNFIYKTINLFLLFVLFSHLTFFHNVVKNYVLCYGTDGHIAIENINDCDDCPETNDFKKLGDTTLNCVHCEDVSIDQSCILDSQFLTTNKEVIFSEKTISLITTLKPNNCLKAILSIDLLLNLNPTLQNYSTVSLLI